MRRAQAQDEFTRFVRALAGRLLRTAYLTTGDLAEAGDLVQECLAKVARRWARVRARDHPEAYARRILINLAVDASPRHRQRRAELRDRRGGALPAAPDPGAARGLGVAEVSAELGCALDALAPAAGRPGAALLRGPGGPGCAAPAPGPTGGTTCSGGGPAGPGTDPAAPTEPA